MVGEDQAVGHEDAVDGPRGADRSNVDAAEDVGQDDHCESGGNAARKVETEKTRGAPKPLERRTEHP